MENSSVKLLHNVLFELSTGNFQCKSSQYFIGFPCCHEKKKKKNWEHSQKGVSCIEEKVFVLFQRKRNQYLLAAYDANLQNYSNFYFIMHNSFKSISYGKVLVKNKVINKALITSIRRTNNFVINCSAFVFILLCEWYTENN